MFGHAVMPWQVDRDLIVNYSRKRVKSRVLVCYNRINRIIIR